MSRKNKTIIALLLPLCTIFAAPTAIAQTDDYDKFGLSFGVFFTDRDTEAQVNSSGGSLGSRIDLENVLGLDSSDNVFRVDGYFRFAKNHQINISAFDLSRDATVLLEQDVTWGGTTFPLSAEVNSNFDLQIYKIDYTWRWIRGDKGYFGPTGGFYVASVDLIIESTNLSLLEDEGLTAPLPVIGFRGEYNFSDKWAFHADAEVFFLEYGDYNGQLYDIYAGVDYRLSKSVAIGLGINSVGMDIGVSKSALAGDIDWSYTGALAYLKFDF